MKYPNAGIQYYSYTNSGIERVSSHIIVETPVSLAVNGDIWLTFMCTPVDVEAMAVGFLFNEGIIDSRDEIADVRLCAAGDNVDVWLNHSVEKPIQWRRTSGCTGGMTSIEVPATVNVVGDGIILLSERVSHLISMLFDSQDLYKTSGGVHISALSDGIEIILSAEDIGRHNTLDKIAGRCLLENIVLPRKVLMTTGRISSDMLQKSARMDASILISRTSPSSLSIQLAEQFGITLIGYARRNRFNVYTHPARILPAHSMLPDSTKMET